MDPFQLAAKQLGMNERDQNAALSEYLTNGGVNLDPAVTAWCAAYVNATLAQSGMEGTGSNMARSFLEWGQEVQDPRKGDIVVFSRGDPSGPYGHVGFFDGFNDDGSIRVLGGNQGDGVSIANYERDRLLGFRRAEGAPVDVATQQAPQQSQNALAPQPEPQRPQIAMMDPRQFMTSQPNALAVQPFMAQRVNYLSGRG